MRRSKKLIVITLGIAVLLVGSIGGVALAQTDSNEGDQPGTLFDRVSAILAGEGVSVTSDQLQAAFSQASGELRNEAMQNHLQYLVEKGKLTQEEADQYQEWLQSKPEGSFGFGSRSHGGFPGMRGFPGMHKMRGFSAPAHSTN